MSIAQRIRALKAELPTGVELVAVSKFHPVEAIAEAYETGQRIFGESKVQELLTKCEQLPQDIRWHFIGHLQTNKVRRLVPHVDLIHSIDSLRLLQEVDKEASRCGRVVDVLLQIHIAQEETKFGLSPWECKELLDLGTDTWPHVRICGLMGMGSNTDEAQVVAAEFAEMHRLFTEVKATYFPDSPFFRELSLGMSHDYPLAIEAGSTLVRVGSLIFGDRH